MDGCSQGEVVENRVLRCNFKAVNILLHSSKNYCTCHEIVIYFAKILISIRKLDCIFKSDWKMSAFVFHYSLTCHENEPCLRHESHWKMMIQFTVTVGSEAASVLYSAYRNM